MEITAEIAGCLSHERLVLGENSAPKLCVTPSSVFWQLSIYSVIKNDKFNIARTRSGLAHEQVARVRISVNKSLLENHVDEHLGDESG